MAFSSPVNGFLTGGLGGGNGGAQPLAPSWRGLAALQWNATNPVQMFRLPH